MTLDQALDRLSDILRKFDGEPFGFSAVATCYAHMLSEAESWNDPVWIETPHGRRAMSPSEIVQAYLIFRVWRKAQFGI